MFLQRFLALLSTRNKEFLRDRSSVGWNIVMPVLIVLGFALVFSGDFADQYKVGVIQTSDPNIEAKAAIDPFLQTKYIEFIHITDLEQAKVKVQRHQLDMLIDAANHRYWINNESPNGYLVEKVMLATLTMPLEKQTVSGKEIRYVDWVIPGILSMNIMFTAVRHR